MAVGLVYDPIYLQHDTGEHPENASRLALAMAQLQQANLLPRLAPVGVEAASLADLARVHDPSLVQQVRQLSQRGGGFIDSDTVVGPRSYEAALCAVGGSIVAVRAVLAGQVQSAFALVRPPGHHATRAEAMGFCLFNNIALGARYALSRHRLNRILIVDWDLHHGDGTAHIFDNDNRVLYFSTHQSPAYPGTGAVREIGQGKGAGFTINVPLRPGAGNAQYVKIYRALLDPVARAFKPELILVSAGFDIYYQDPLGEMKVTPRGFAYLTRILMNIADDCCGGKLVMVLEGGYHIDGLTESVKSVLRELCDETQVTDEELFRIEGEGEERFSPTEPLIQSVMEQIKPYWKIFQ